LETISRTIGAIEELLKTIIPQEFPGLVEGLFFVQPLQGDISTLQTVRQILCG